MKKKTIIIGTLAIALVIVSIIIASAGGKNPGEYKMESARVTRASIKNTVTATGTIQALKTIAVGTQISGVINKLYVDYNSHVKKGQLLAKLDETPLRAVLEENKASVSDAKANLDYQAATYNRTKALFEKKMASQSDYDQALYNKRKAEASLKTANARYKSAKINLAYACIYSPIDGVVLNRAVDEGQTVAASFSTPTLFSIANDLTQMQVEANIDEADIGQIRQGQRVEFTVDAYPDKQFDGQVVEVRLQPVTTSNVVTYTVIIKAPNPSKILMPGMTANISVIVQETPEVLTLPSTALNFKPDAAMLKYFGLDSSRLPKRRPVPNEVGLSEVWVRIGKSIRPVEIQTGSTDGIRTEVKAGLREGEEVIISMSQVLKAETSSKGEESPFMPKHPGGKK